MSEKVVIIPGDGIGPEIMDSALEVLNAVSSNLEFIKIEAGLNVWKRKGYAISGEDLEEIKRHKVILKGPIATPIERGMYKSINVLLRKTLNLYANLRIFKSIPGISPFKNVDIALVRENTEGLYSGMEFRIMNDAAIAIRLITREGSRRVIKFAFNYALRNNRRKVTVIHKANILRETDGLFLEIARKISKDYPSIELEELIVDAAAYKLIKNPEIFDVIVTSNMFGDILSDEVAGMVGSIGLVPSANIGDKYALFEAVHGAAFDIANKGIANPVGLILSAALMLDYLGMPKKAEAIRNAVMKALSEKECRTPDLGGKATTKGFTRKVLEYLS
ncbi:NAD-dependent isocitrate dehydrogenase [Candidatus Geothermarchaeota archaeon]|nr:MAG: NAD-dependent isocitrate dehydrogenase [Candidatus Geothermarchaeota archaeon]